MPQFDVSTYLSQIFWFLVSFGLLYSFIRFAFLPSFDSVLAKRASLMKSLRSSIDSIKDDLEVLEARRRDAISDAKFAADNIVADAKVVVSKVMSSVQTDFCVAADNLRMENAEMLSTFMEVNSEAIRLMFMEIANLQYASIFVLLSVDEGFSNFSDNLSANFEESMRRFVKCQLRH